MTDPKTRIAAADSLGEMLAVLNDIWQNGSDHDRQSVDLADLPVFSEREPSDTSWPIWSWDDENALVDGDGGAKFRTQPWAEIELISEGKVRLAPNREPTNDAAYLAGYHSFDAGDAFSPGFVREIVVEGYDDEEMSMWRMGYEQARADNNGGGK